MVNLNRSRFFESEEFPKWNQYSVKRLVPYSYSGSDKDLDFSRHKVTKGFLGEQLEKVFNSTTISVLHSKRLETVFKIYVGIWGPFTEDFWKKFFDEARKFNNLENYLFISRLEAEFNNKVGISDHKHAREYNGINRNWERVILLRLIRGNTQNVIYSGEFFLLFAHNRFMGDKDFSGSLAEWLSIPENWKTVKKNYDTFKNSENEFTASIYNCFSRKLFGSIHAELTEENFDRYLNLKKKDWEKIFSYLNSNPEGFFYDQDKANNIVVKNKLDEFLANTTVSVDDLNRIFLNSLFKTFIRLCQNEIDDPNLHTKAAFISKMISNLKFRSNFQWTSQAKSFIESMEKIENLTLTQFTCILFSLKNPHSWLSTQTKDYWELLSMFSKKQKVEKFATLVESYVLESFSNRPSFDEWKNAIETNDDIL